MENHIKEFIDRYKDLRAQHLDSQYLFKQKKENKKMSDLDLIAQDEDFYNTYLLDAQGLAALRKTSITKTRWASLAFALKNRSEIINSKIDFFNYMHTLLAICLPLFILAAQKIDPWNAGLAVICVFFIFWIFKIRSELRVELSTAKELANVFERLSKDAI